MGQSRQCVFQANDRTGAGPKHDRALRLVLNLYHLTNERLICHATQNYKEIVQSPYKSRIFLLFRWKCVKNIVDFKDNCLLCSYLAWQISFSFIIRLTAFVGNGIFIYPMLVTLS